MTPEDAAVTQSAVDYGWILWVLGMVAAALVGGVVGAFISKNRRGTNDARPIYWNLIAFALIGAGFSVFAILNVDEDDKSGIALLFLGMIGGYAVSIKELDLAKLEIEKLRLELGSSDGHADEESEKGKKKDEG